jgi:hypothetical protein
MHALAQEVKEQLWAIVQEKVHAAYDRYEQAMCYNVEDNPEGPSG